MKKIIFLMMVTLAVANSKAAVVPSGLKNDYRITQINYTPNDVIRIPVSFGYVTEIQLGNEAITNLARGDAQGWSIKNTANRIYVKPVMPTMKGAEDTNFTVTTDKRNYVFVVYNAPRNKAFFVVRFNYSDSPAIKEAVTNLAPSVAALSPECSGKYSKMRRKYKNIAYGQSGSAEISVFDTFDDGEFTFFKLDPRRPMPALYLVNSEGKEELVNTRQECDYLIAEKTGDLFVMRDGKLHKCIKKLRKESI